jgi:hypothetical protein
MYCILYISKVANHLGKYGQFYFSLKNGGVKQSHREWGGGEYAKTTEIRGIHT